MFKDFETIRLRTNHRLAPDQQQYKNFLMRVGTGIINDHKSRIQLPKKMCANSTLELLEFVFPRALMVNPQRNWRELAGRAILTPTNDRTFQLNGTVMVNIDL